MDSKDKLVTLEDLKAVHDEVARYTTCSTAAGTGAKVVALTNFALTTGSCVRVKFTNTNTAGNVTLNVNNTGAKPIMQYGVVPVGTDVSISWNAGEVVEFVYDGTNWVIVKPNYCTSINIYKGTMGVAPNTSKDFNDYVNVGTYYNTGTNESGVLNPPHSEDNGHLVVEAFANVRILQVWYGAYTGLIKIRHYNGGTETWSPWYTVMTSEGGTFNGNVIVEKRSGSTALADSYLVAGNNIPNGTAGNSRGVLELFSEQSYYSNIYPRTLTANRSLYVPDATGTIAIQDRILKQEASVEVVGNPSGWVYKDITFPTPFIRPPLVSVSLYGTSYATDWTMPMLANVTQTGFQMGWWHASGTRNVYWQAFGII